MVDHLSNFHRSPQPPPFCPCSVLLFVCFDLPMLAEAIGVNFLNNSSGKWWITYQISIAAPDIIATTSIACDTSMVNFRCMELANTIRFLLCKVPCHHTDTNNE